MRDLLLKRVRPLAESFAKQLTEIAEARIQAELERMGEAFEVAMSAFASEVTHDDPDRRDHDPVPQVPRGPRRGLQQAEARADAAQGAKSRRPAREPAPRLVTPPEDLIADAVELGLREPVDVDAPSRAFPADRRGRADKTALTASGKQPPTCSYVGGNSRGCGTSHKTQAPVAPTPDQMANAMASSHASAKPFDVHEAMKRPYPPLKPTDRRAAISNWATRQASSPPRHQAAERDEDDDRDEPEPTRPPGSERWTKGRIALEKDIAEARKAKGEMPAPSSSFDLGHDGAESGMASVREVGPEDELDFEASA